VVGRVAHEEPFPHERLPLPQQSLSVLIHLRPQAHQVKRAVEPHLVLRALDEHDIAVAWAADALVADGFARDLHCLGTEEEWIRGGPHTTIDAAPREDRRRHPSAPGGVVVAKRRKADIWRVASWLQLRW